MTLISNATVVCICQQDFQDVCCRVRETSCHLKTKLHSSGDAVPLSGQVLTDWPRIGHTLALL